MVKKVQSYTVEFRAEPVCQIGLGQTDGITGC